MCASLRPRAPPREERVSPGGGGRPGRRAAPGGEGTAHLERTAGGDAPERRPPSGRGSRAIRARPPRKGAKTAVTVLANVTLTVPDGRMVAVQGPTGGGRSTLLQLLGALDRPTSGSVRLDGRELSSAPDGALAAVRGTEVGIVFQNVDLIPTLTALENVEAALALQRVRAGERAERARAALVPVGPGDRVDHLPAELSGGRQQRVAIARALVEAPRVLLADEPTGALEEGTRDEIMLLLEELWWERGLTLILVTHDSAVARRAQRHLHLAGGRLREAA
ncbi:peptide ABC transporter ATP-binding protein [Rathayibacter sp. AY1B5]|nr:peptide ABC transporter ATP-binding protein [Rathayibacter sp. AY1B5]